MGRVRAKVEWELRRRLEQRRTERLLAGVGSVGRGVRLSGHSTITGADRLVLGDNVHIGDGAFIRAEGGLTIGDNTHVSRNLVLYTMNHDYQGERLPYDDHQLLQPVTIGRNVWIGMNCCILPGATIGDGAIVGMGTVVGGEVPPLTIIGSQKWRVIGQRDAGHYERLDRAGAYGGSGGRAFPPHPAPAGDG